MPFMISGQETEWALFLQPRSPHRALECSKCLIQLTSFNDKYPEHIGKYIGDKLCRRASYGLYTNVDN